MEWHMSFRITLQSTHQWVQALFADGIQETHVDSSYIPQDPIYELILGLTQVATTTGEIVVEWQAEPTIYHLVFQVYSEYTRFHILQPKKQSSSQRDSILFSTHAETSTVLIVFWRALRAFKYQSNKILSHHTTFPEREFQIFERIIGK
jgi:hypothetical protein